MNNSMPASMHKRQDSMISLGGGSTSGDDFFASVAGFDDFGANGEDELDLMDGEDESKDSLGDLQQDGSGGPAKKLKRPPSTAEKKATHNAVERARRESLNGRFLVLADMLPGMNHVKRASKAAIVNKSIDLINDLRATEIQLNKENTALKQELEALRSRGANNGATASATGPLTPGMPLPLPAGMQGPAAAHAAAAAAAAMIAAGHHPHTHPALAGLTGQLPPPLAFQQQLQQQMQQDGGAGMMSSLNGQQQPPLTPNGPLSAQQMHEHAAAMTMAAHQHQFLQQQHHLAQQQAQAQAQAQAQVQAQQQQQMQAQHQQQMQAHIFPGVFNGFFNGVGLLDTLESARSESGSPTSVHSSAQQQAILGTSPSSSHFAYNATGVIPQLPTPAPAIANAAAAYFNEAALTASSTSPSSSAENNNNNLNSNNSLHTLLGNAASANTPPASHYSPISFHSPSSSSTFAQQRLGSRGTGTSGSSGNEGTAPSPASSHSVPTPPNATYSPPSSTTSAILKKDSDAASAAVAAVQPALASPLLPNTFEDANAKAQADLQQYFAYQQRLASLNSAQAAQAQAAAAAAAMGFLPSHAAAALAQAQQQQQQQGAGNTSPNSATFGANGQGMNIPAWQLMMAQHQALSTYGGVTGPTHF